MLFKIVERKTNKVYLVLGQTNGSFVIAKEEGGGMKTIPICDFVKKFIYKYYGDNGLEE